MTPPSDTDVRQLVDALRYHSVYCTARDGRLLKGASIVESLLLDRERMGWRPIETAPRDGSEFDAWAVWIDTGEGERVANVKWGRGYIAFESERGELEGWLAEAWGIDGCDGIMDSEDQMLTHWMQLPEPPALNRSGG